MRYYEQRASAGLIVTEATHAVTVTHNEADGGADVNLSGVINWGALVDPTTGASTGSGHDTIGGTLGSGTSYIA